MTKKQLEQQAKEYGMTVSEIKEYRKHIKPFLKYAIGELNVGIKENHHVFLCHEVNHYTSDYKVQRYLFNRLWAAIPKDAEAELGTIIEAWFGRFKVVTQNKKKLAFCRQQLKLVKP